MLYKQNQKTKKLDTGLFRNPTSDYRSAPFWAWNSTLDKDEMLRQIEEFKKMGFGGFHMHTRCGMNTKYLSEEFMDIIRACTEKAEAENMHAYLYDEDRWPSGAAGGFVTKTPKYREKRILFTREKMDSTDKETGNEKGIPYLIACFDVTLNENGLLEEYSMIPEDAEAKGKKWYAYVTTRKLSGWYNNQTYVDTMSKEAIAEFIKVTHEAYKKAVGDKFGTVIPSIFSDEPELGTFEQPALLESDEHSRFPWTYDLNETYKSVYGDDLISKLPELRWNTADGKAPVTRYRYFDHITERFTEGFFDQIGKWCSENGIYFIGHDLNEPELNQAYHLGEAMHTYRGYGIPGIDMLCNAIELSTAKQAQSAAHQYGREGVMSELYGVTGWGFDFRGHKFQGDWQAALGITLRVPHLSWYSMKGSAKRDYPASIHYQSPWYKEYTYIEDHFARLNTVLTRGKPVVNVGIIHPIESYWLCTGRSDEEGRIQEDKFKAIINCMLGGQIDFDFISESLLKDIYKDTSDKRFAVGEMSYRAVVVPKLRTIRKTTIDALEKFVSRGGKVIFIGDRPLLVDAVESDAAKDLYDRSLHVTSEGFDLLTALDDERDVRIIKLNGNSASDLIYAERSDGDDRYIFIAHAKYDPNYDISIGKKLKIVVRGEYHPEILDTLSGDINDIPYEIENGYTNIYYTLYNSDSLLLRLSPAVGTSSGSDIPKEYQSGNNVGSLDDSDDSVKKTDFKDTVRYRRCEDNVLLLDMAEWKLSDSESAFRAKEEVLRIDGKIRRKFAFPPADGRDIQPWAIEEETISHFPILRFTFTSEIECDCSLAYEEATEIIFNGENIPVTADGYFVDKSIHRMAMPRIRKGENELIVKVPLGKRIGIEDLYLLGDFDVEINGTTSTVKAPSTEIAFGSIVDQGLPFYGGNIEYEADFESGSGSIDVIISKYRAPLLKVSVDDSTAQALAYAPYTVHFEGLSRGKHTLKVTCFGNRNNTFGCVHMCDDTLRWIGPNAWYSIGNAWSYQYCLKNTGVLVSPVIFEK